MTTVGPVTVEHHREPLGIGEAAPRLSWVTGTDERDWVQTAYQLQVGDRTCDRVESRDSVLVPWPVEPLTSRDRRTVRVRVWGPDGDPSDWSPEVVVEAGLLEPTDWTASLVRPVLGDADEPVALLRRGFTLDAPIVSARLYATAQGVFEAELNGAAVGDEVLAPGWTSYTHRLRYLTWDVTDRVVEGRNALGLALADGWFRGALGFTGKRAFYGDRTGAFAQLEVEHADGSRTVVTTDGSWRSTTDGPVTRAGLYSGETHDCRRELPGWSSPGFDDTAWTPVEVGTLDTATLVAPTGPPVRRTEVVPPSRSAGRRPGPCWWTSARTWSAASASRCPTPPPAPRSRCGTPRCWSTASWAPARCAVRGPPTSSSTTARARGRGSRGSRCTASGTPRSPAGRAS